MTLRELMTKEIKDQHYMDYLWCQYMDCFETYEQYLDAQSDESFLIAYNRVRAAHLEDAIREQGE